MTKRCDWFAYYVAALVYVMLINKFTNGIDYRGYKVYAVQAADGRQENLLHKISEEHRQGIDIWAKNRLDGTHIMVSPELQHQFEQLIHENGLPIRIIIDDVGSKIDEEKNENFSARRSITYNADRFDFNRFPRYSEIVHFIRQLSNSSRYATIINIGYSYEGRALIGMRIKANNDNPAIFVDAGIHAREWAAPVTALYLMKKVIEMEEIFARKVSIYIIPSVNPDGYEYSHTTDRLWRKTRSVNPNSSCKGVDGNRNFDSHWAEVGVNLNPCSASYPGPRPFSEFETRAIRDALLEIKPVLYLTFHSFGSFFLYPWGFTSTLPKNWKELCIVVEMLLQEGLAHAAASKSHQVNGEVYIVGSSTNVLYPASGGSDDYAMEKVGVPLAYTVELPDYGGGFEMSAKKIKPMVAEAFEAFKVLVNYVCATFGSNCA